MRNYEFFSVNLENEIPKFTKVLRAVPSDRFDYRPHEKNTSAGDLAWQIATEMVHLNDLVQTGVMDYKPQPRPATSEEIATTFESAARTMVAKSRAVDEKLWKGPGKFLWGGQTVWEAAVAEIAWGFLFDLIHHRGQLTVYLRPMGAKVPAVYGPSADENE
jgi:uncharacterized damage-inducible protein DinB